MQLPRKALAKLRGPGTLAAVDLPVPPSSNNLFPTQSGTRRRFPSRAYTAWKLAARPLVEQMAPARRYPVEVWITLTGAKVNPMRDVANVEKAITDMLVECGILEDDRLEFVAGVHLVYRPDDGPERVRVRLETGGGA